MSSLTPAQLLLPLPVLGERAGERAEAERAATPFEDKSFPAERADTPFEDKSPLPNPLPEYRESEAFSWRLLMFCLLLTLAMLAKPVAVVVPLIAAVIDLICFQRSLRCTLGRLWLSFLLILPIILIARGVQANYVDVATPLWTRPLIAGDALAFYLAKLIWPATLTHLYGRTPMRVVASPTLYWTWLLPALAGLTLLGAARRRPVVLAGAAVFVIALVPVLGFTPFEFQIHSTVADHYLYLSMLGVAMVVAGFLSPAQRLPPSPCTRGEGGGEGRAERADTPFDLKSPRAERGDTPFENKSPLPNPLPEYREREGSSRLSLVFCAISAILLALAVRSHFQLRYWSDSISLNTHAVAVSPDSTDAHGSLGESFLAAGRIADAVREYQFILARTPLNFTAHLRLAQAYLALQQFDRALTHARMAVRLTPDRNVYPLVLQAEALNGLGRRDEAVQQLHLAQRINPNNAAVMQQLEQYQPPSTQQLP